MEKQINYIQRSRFNPYKKISHPRFVNCEHCPLFPSGLSNKFIITCGAGFEVRLIFEGDLKLAHLAAFWGSEECKLVDVVVAVEKTL